MAESVQPPAVLGTKVSILLVRSCQLYSHGKIAIISSQIKVPTEH
jgi:hypothetical protein